MFPLTVTTGSRFGCFLEGNGNAWGAFCDDMAYEGYNFSRTREFDLTGLVFWSWSQEGKSASVSEYCIYSEYHSSTGEQYGHCYDTSLYNGYGNELLSITDVTLDENGTYGTSSSYKNGVLVSEITITSGYFHDGNSDILSHSYNGVSLSSSTRPADANVNVAKPAVPKATNYEKPASALYVDTDDEYLNSLMKNRLRGMSDTARGNCLFFYFCLPMFT